MSTPVTNSSSSSNDQQTTPTVPQTKPVDKNMFMQLLIAQLRNQDPMSPQDGTAFIGQLAQFQQLEQSVNTGQDISSIRTDLDSLVGNQAGQTTQSGKSS